MPSSGTELIELVTQALAHPQFSSTNQTVRLLQTAQASGDNSSTSIVNNFFFWAINITLMAVAVSLIIWCCKYNGAGQFSAWLNGGITSDQQHARNVMLRREKEANARRLSPAQQRKLLKRTWEQNNVCMVSFHSIFELHYTFIWNVELVLRNAVIFETMLTILTFNNECQI